MEVAIGLKAHSGWAALVALGVADGVVQVVERRRLALVDEGAAWARQPYHAAQGLRREEARHTVARGVASARRLARRELGAAIKDVTGSTHRIAACAVLTGAPMPAWTVDEILAVHVRMHTAEGALFRDALVQAVEASRLALVTIPERALADRVRQSPARCFLSTVAGLGRSIGAPWGRDQKDASLAALVALNAEAVD